jgi:hypothetical protein
MPSPSGLAGEMQATGNNGGRQACGVGGAADSPGAADQGGPHHDEPAAPKCAAPAQQLHLWRDPLAGHALHLRGIPVTGPALSGEQDPWSLSPAFLRAASKVP